MNKIKIKGLKGTSSSNRGKKKTSNVGIWNLQVAYTMGEIGDNLGGVDRMANLTVLIVEMQQRL